MGTVLAFAAERRAAVPLLLSAPAACTRRRQLSTDISRPAVQSAANPVHAAAAVDRRDRQTDGLTDARPFRKPGSAYYAGMVTNTPV